MFAAYPAWFWIAGSGVLGLLVGSFLNVVAHRLPRMHDRREANYLAALRSEPVPYPDRYDLGMPRSACPRCGHAITAWENIPVVSYLLLRGRCAACRTPIGVRYPLVELASAALAGAAAWQFGPTWQCIAAFGLLWCLLALSLIDADTLFLPDEITLPLLWAGLLLNLQSLFVPLADAVIGAACGYLVLWGVNHAYRLVRGRDGMGYGDAKLLAALGAWLGWQVLPLLLIVSALAGALYGLANQMLGSHDRGTYLPFGPFIAAAGVLALFAGDAALSWMLSLALRG